MEKYELKNKYEDDDEIDLVELLKAVIRERKLIAVITVLFTLLAGGFVFYKNSKPSHYGVEISFSEDTKKNINLYNSLYKHSSVIFNESLDNSFKALKEIKNSDITVFSSENKKEIREILKDEYNFIKILDFKNKTYKLFTNIKHNELENVSKKIDKVIFDDTNNLNLELEKNISKSLTELQDELVTLTDETEKLNKLALEIINENFKDVPKENISANLSMVSPVLYVEYNEKIKSLDSIYLKVSDLKKLKDESKELFKLSGKDDIKIIKLDEFSENSDGLNSFLILAIGLIFGLFAGMFIAIIKEPLINILKEAKKEK